MNAKPPPTGNSGCQSGPSRFARDLRARGLGIFTVMALLAGTCCVRSDQVKMKNGDRYVGKVVSMNNDSLVFENEMIGKVSLPRGNVALITLGSRATTNSTAMSSSTNIQGRALALGVTNRNATLSAALRDLGQNTNDILQVQKQLLSDAGPEANKKFNELLSGLMSGKLSVNDLRAQAKSVAEQARALKRDLGEDAGGALDSYLAILDSFLNETEPTNNASSKR